MMVDKYVRVTKSVSVTLWVCVAVSETVAVAVETEVMKSVIVAVWVCKTVLVYIKRSAIRT
jgi:hypothetical protein